MALPANTASRSVRLVALIGSGRALVILAGLVTIRLATGLMGPSQYGAISQMLSLANLAFSLLVTPVYMLVMRRQLEWADTGQLLAALLSTANILVRIALIVSVCGIAVQLAVTRLQIPGFSPWAFGAALATFLFLNGMQMIGAGGLINFGHRQIYVALNILVAWGGLACAVAAFRLFGTPSAWLIGIFLGYGVGLLSYVLLWREAAMHVQAGGASAARMDYLSLIRFGWPQTVCFGLNWLQTQSYRFIAADMDGLAVVGILTSGYSLCSVAMQAFESLFNDLYMPGMLKALKFRDAEGAGIVWSEYAAALVPALLVFGSFLSFVAPYAAYILLGSRFRAAVAIVPFFALAETMRACSFQAVAQLGLAKSDLRIAIWPGAAGALGSLISVPLLARQNPMFGTASAIAISYIFVFVASWLVVRRTSGAHWPFRKVGAAILLASPFMVATGLLQPGPGWSLTKLLAIPAGATLYLVILQLFLARGWIARIAHGGVIAQ